jgi:hypothetical protein
MAIEHLTEQECERVRYHLGYMATGFGSEQAAASLQLGTARPVQTAFLLEEAIKNLLTNIYALDRVRKILNILDNIEQQMLCATAQLGVEKLGEITLRGAKAGETHTDMLEREYRRWAKRLADVLGVPFYPFSGRFNTRGPGRNFAVS